MQRIHLQERTYYDSVTLMLVAREVLKIDGVTKASLSMGTEANLKILTAAGFTLEGIAPTPNDLLIAIDSRDDIWEEALGKAKEYLANPPWKKGQSGGDYRPKTVDGAISVLSDANLALISVAGRYAGDEALKCLEAGLNVMLYSDNVTIEKEIEVKQAAREKGLLVMGPDCGTAIIRGVAIGMANKCPVGPVGIVAAAGTGLQEVHVQLAHRSVGVLHGIGTGGRDVKAKVGGIMCLMGLEALIADDEIKTILAIGKPPAPEVETKMLDLLKGCGKPAVLGFVGGKETKDLPPVYVCTELEETAAVAAALSRGEDPQTARADLTKKNDALQERAKTIGTRKGYVRGLFSGGTLCYEAQLVASRMLGNIWSNVPLAAEMQLADSLASKGHCMVDYGEDEFTQGRLHPMIDVSLRAERILEEAKDPEVGVILLDVVLGYGCHENPARQLAEGIAKAKAVAKDRVAFVAYVCGVDDDPQNAAEQKKILEDAGVHVCDSNAQAARLAAYLIER